MYWIVLAQMFSDCSSIQCVCISEQWWTTFTQLHLLEWPCLLNLWLSFLQDHPMTAASKFKKIFFYFKSHLQFENWYYINVFWFLLTFLHLYIVTKYYKTYIFLRFELCHKTITKAACAELIGKKIKNKSHLNNTFSRGGWGAIKKAIIIWVPLDEAQPLWEVWEILLFALKYNRVVVILFIWMTWTNKKSLNQRETLLLITQFHFKKMQDLRLP